MLRVMSDWRKQLTFLIELGTIKTAKNILYLHCVSVSDLVELSCLKRKCHGYSIIRYVVPLIEGKRSVNKIWP